VSQPNRDLLDRAIRIYEQSVRKYIIDRFKRRKGGWYFKFFASSFPETFEARGSAELVEDDFVQFLEAKTFAKVLQKHPTYFPELVYRRSLAIAKHGGRAIDWIHEIHTWRNVVSHPPPSDLGTKPVVRTLDAIQNVLRLIGATEALAEVQRLRNDAIPAPDASAEASGAMEGLRRQLESPGRDLRPPRRNGTTPSANAGWPRTGCRQR